MTDRELILALRTIEVPDRHACFGCGYERNCGLHGCVIIKEAIRRIEAAQQSNNPLTLEELREMDGDPVWVVQVNGELRPMWMLVDAEDESAANRLYAAMFEDYGAEWIAYRHKPEEV